MNDLLPKGGAILLTNEEAARIVSRPASVSISPRATGMFTARASGGSRVKPLGFCAPGL